MQTRHDPGQLCGSGCGWSVCPVPGSHSHPLQLPHPPQPSHPPGPPPIPSPSSPSPGVCSNPLRGPLPPSPSQFPAFPSPANGGGGGIAPRPKALPAMSHPSCGGQTVGNAIGDTVASGEEVIPASPGMEPLEPGIMGGVAMLQPARPDGAGKTDAGDMTPGIIYSIST
ncbi:MAG: hypothetical protein JWQ98_1930 [Chlorobi bacterium]|nr:hypothetical protein [Chlorobiota bacterium]